MAVTKVITDYRNRLIRKAKRIGLWENFGNEEIRVLKDIYSEHRWIQKVGGGCGDAVWQEIIDFEQWCLNINDTILEKL